MKWLGGRESQPQPSETSRNMGQFAEGLSGQQYRAPIFSSDFVCSLLRILPQRCHSK